MKMRLPRKLTTIICFIITASSTFANSLTIDNQTDYFVWVEKIDYSGGWWQVYTWGANDLPQFNPIRPHKKEGASWAVYDVGYGSVKGIIYWIAPPLSTNPSEPNLGLKTKVEGELSPSGGNRTVSFSKEVKTNYMQTNIITFSVSAVKDTWAAFSPKYYYTVTITEKLQ